MVAFVCGLIDLLAITLLANESGRLGCGADASHAHFSIYFVRFDLLVNAWPPICKLRLRLLHSRHRSHKLSSATMTRGERYRPGA
jgi:hypothetical protein